MNLRSKKKKGISGPNLSNMVTFRQSFTKYISKNLLRDVDGMHRSVALASGGVIGKVQWAAVVLHILEDPELMTELECIVLVARYNVGTSNSLPITSMDRTHSLASIQGTIDSLIKYGKAIPGMKGYGDV